jgi:hypothetical protein
VTDREGFLARWSRLKREADEAGAEAAPDPGEPTPNAAESREPSAPPPSGEAASGAEPDAPAVDLAALPPIETITAATDIRAFLASGVPGELTRAALSRAWAADPAIRDFVGLAENAWDFNNPDAMPGFGPILRSHDGQTAVTDMVGHQSFPSGSSPEGHVEPLQKPNFSAPRKEPPGPGVEAEAPVADKADKEIADRPDDAAMQQEIVDEQSRQGARRHGGALPAIYDEET